MIKMTLGWILACASLAIIFKGKLFVAKERKIRAFNLTYHLPVVNWDSTVNDLVQSYDVYYYHDLIMYRYEYTYDSVENGELKLREDRKFFFVFQRDSLYGYILDPNPFHVSPDRRAPVDSMKKGGCIENNILEKFLGPHEDSLYFDANGNKVKVYNLAPTKENHGGSTYYLYYSKGFKDIEESFARNLDTVKNMKLVKIRGVIHKAYYEEFKMNFPERELYYEMKRIPIENGKLIEAYFGKYKKLILKKNWLFLCQ